MCSNDAKSCYDRITHSVTSLCMRRMGVEEPPIVCMFTTIQNLEHYNRTAYGVSELSFTGKLCDKVKVQVSKSGLSLVPRFSTCYGMKATGPTFRPQSLAIPSPS
jgi:hypothetical protein